MAARRWVRHLVDVLALGAGALRRAERRARSSVTILTYHRVLPDAACAAAVLPKLVVPESVFRAQVAWLARRVRVVPAIEAFEALGAGDAEVPVVAITFDDGYRDNAEIAAPALAEHGLRATFYVTTGFVEGRTMWFDRAALHWRRSPAACRAAAASSGGAQGGPPEDGALSSWMSFLKSAAPARRAEIVERLDRDAPLGAALDGYRPMTVEQVRALHGAGHEVGSHTRFHGFLPQATDAELADEIAGARETLRRWTGATVAGFCYPNGDADDRVVAAVRAAGHVQACTTADGAAAAGDDPLRLPRRMVDPTAVSAPSGAHSTIAFRAEAFGLHAALRRGARLRAQGPSPRGDAPARASR